MRSFITFCVLAGMINSLIAADEAAQPSSNPAKEHEFMQRFVGEWECEGEAYFVPGQPPMKVKSEMTGERIGDYWATLVVTVPSEESPYHGRGTFGYDARKKKCVGTWTDSMSSHLALLEGKVDGDKLILHAESPHPTEPTKLVKFRDTWHFEKEDLLILTSHIVGDDGKMTLTMKSTCKRKK